MNRTAALSLLVLVGVSGLLGGCYDPSYTSPLRMQRGLVMVFTGIEGRSPFNESICDNLVLAGVPYAVRLEDWTIGVPGAYLVNLRNEQRNRRQADFYASRITEYRMSHPNQPVILVGQSGGAAMAVWTAEALEMDQQVEGIILLAATLSPEYALDRALENSRRGIINFFSPNDRLFLGFGTTAAGTMDGYFGSSAGRVGFHQQAPSMVTPRGAGRKLYQVAWNPAMRETGHWGGHISTSAGAFIQDFVAPLVTAPQWNRQVIDDIVYAGKAPPTDAGRAVGVYDRY